MKHQVTLRTAILPEWEASQSRLLLKTSGSPDSHYCFLMWCFSCSKHEEVFGQEKLSFFKSKVYSETQWSNFLHSHTLS